MKKSLKLFIDSLDVLDELSDEQAGVLFKAIRDYEINGTENLSGLMKAIFTPFKNNIDRAKVAYSEACERNKANGLKGGRPKAKKSDTKQNKPSGLKSNPKNPDKDKDKDKDKIRYKQEIINYLNQVTGKRFRGVDNKFLNARVNDGYIFTDFKKVIDIKSKQWLNTEHDKYLRPDTLFGTKFDSYLNEKINIVKEEPLSDMELWGGQ